MMERFCSIFLTWKRPSILWNIFIKSIMQLNLCGSLIAHNKGKVPDRDLMRIMILMHTYVDDYINVWKEHIGSVKYIDE